MKLNLFIRLMSLIISLSFLFTAVGQAEFENRYADNPAEQIAVDTSSVSDMSVYQNFLEKRYPHLKSRRDSIVATEQSSAASQSLQSPLFISNSSSEIAVNWQRTYGGIGFYSTIETSDNGLVSVGSIRGYQSIDEDIFLVKTQSDGAMLWKKAFGGENTEVGIDVVEAQDNGYIILSRTASRAEDTEKIYLVKIDKDGNVNWDRVIDSTNKVYPQGIEVSSDGNYMIGGYTTGYIYLMKIDINGNILWEKILKETVSKSCLDIKITDDGGYILTGWSWRSPNYQEVYLLKIDSNGNKEWEKEYGREYIDEGYEITQVSDGGYVVVGRSLYYSYNDGNKQDYYVIKVDKDGNKQWENLCDNDFIDWPFSVIESFDGGYIVGGYTILNYGVDIYLVKFNVNGDIEWEDTLDISQYDALHSIIKSNDGSYIIGGVSGPNDPGGGLLVNLQTSEVSSFEVTNIEYTSSPLYSGYDQTLNVTLVDRNVSTQRFYKAYAECSFDGVN